MTISQDTLMLAVVTIGGAIFSAMFGILWFFLQAKFKKIDEVHLIVLGQQKDMSAFASIVSELRPKLDDLVMVKREQSAAWKVIDEVKLVANDLKQQMGLVRERQHDLASQIMIVKGKCDRTHGESGQTDWPLKPVLKEEGK